ncbi:MAG: glycosyltransferase family 87 protein [Candidatus Limnocylindria bacterium]
MKWSRIPGIVALAITVGIGIATIIWAVGDLHFNDLDSYRSAALRIRAGDQLYGGDVTPFNKYYYAPWFAYAFVPFSYLPRGALIVVWTTITIASTGVAMWPLVRHRSPEALTALAFFGPTLFALSLSGNVHAPMLAALVVLLHTRWGPVAIGVAASLKATPILLVIAYVGRGEWARAATALAVAAILWAPILSFELAPITFDSGGAALRLEFWIAVASVGSAAALLTTILWPRHRWLASSAAVFMATPRLYVYDITILALAVAPSTARRQVDRRAHHSPDGATFAKSRAARSRS